MGGLPTAATGISVCTVVLDIERPSELTVSGVLGVITVVPQAAGARPAGCPASGR